MIKLRKYLWCIKILIIFFCVCKKLEIKFAYLAFVLFLKLSVRILGAWISSCTANDKLL